MSTYIYREDSGYDEQFEAATDEDAEQRARDMLRDGDWGQASADKTFTVRAQFARVMFSGDDAAPGRDGGLGSWRTVSCTFEPAVPPCPGRGSHDWQDGAASGSGGGVKYEDFCAHCGLRRVTDTWDHDPATGEVMETVRYETPAG